MFPESDLLPISALQHLLYCRRQCALIHVERLWAENRLTVEGRHLHDRAHGGKADRRGDLRVARGLPLRSLRLGLFGQADVVEFRGEPALAGVGADEDALLPFPIEYKRGRPKSNDADRVQLCAQALCLEEMLGTPVPAGAIFYGKTRRRMDVSFDAPLRALTLRAIDELHGMIRSGTTPRAQYDRAKCGRCSLLSLCLPTVQSGREPASRYVARSLSGILVGAGPSSDAFP